MVDTKDKIIDAAIDLFAQNGYTETSVRGIAEAVQIKPASIYNHFDSKAEILETIIEEYQTHMLGNAVTLDGLDELDGKTALRGMFYSFSPDEYERMTKILKIMLHEQYREVKAREFMRSYMFRACYDYLKSVMDRLVELKKIPPVNTGVYAKLFMSILLTASVEVMHFSPEEFRYMHWNTSDSAINFLIDQIMSS